MKPSLEAKARLKRPVPCPNRVSNETISSPETTTAPMPDETISPIAAIVYRPTDNVEVVLVEVARALAARGVKLGGVLQHDIATVIDDPCAMELEDLDNGERFSLSQALGSGSEACRLDPASLAHAAVSVRRAVDKGVELVMINKFGAQEVSGSGLRAEMGVAVLAGIPLLTAVGERFLPDWQDFTGGESALLKPDTQAVLAWWDALQQDV